jgi:hypothetical protein
MNAIRNMRGALRTGRLNKVSKMSRCRKIAALAGVAVASSTAVLSFGSAAFAGTGWTSAGATGVVSENAVPAECYNLYNGYSVVAIGPSVYGFTSGGMSTEIATFTTRLYDASTGKYSAWYSWSPEYYVTASHGVNYSAIRDVFSGTHSHQQYVEVYVEWLNTAGTAVVGTKEYWVSSYYNSAALGGYPMSYCAA